MKDIKEGQLIKSEPHEFRDKAIGAYEKTYTILFDQAQKESDTLVRTNEAISILQNELLDPERIELMDVSQKISLLELLTKSSQTNITNLSRFATLFNDIRSVVGTYDGIKQFSKNDKDH